MKVFRGMMGDDAITIDAIVLSLFIAVADMDGNNNNNEV